MQVDERLQSQNRISTQYERLLMRLMIIAPCFFIRFTLDNDAYWLIQSGRYVLEHGIPVTDPLSMHSGLTFVMQQWLSAVCFASIYDTFGVIGILVMVLIVFIAMALLIQQLTLLVSGNEFVSYIVTILSVIVLWPFMTTRPFLISLLFFLIEILILEKVVRSGKHSLLVAIPFLSVMLVNFHAAMWPFFFIIFVPYFIDSYQFNFGCFHGEGYPRFKMLLAFSVSLLVGFLNPYGIKSMTYLFRSYGHQSISKNVLEMQSPNFQTGSGLFVFAVLILVVIILIVTKAPKLKLRYGLLILGTGFMALTSLRNLSLFAVCGMPMLAYALRELSPKTGMVRKISMKVQVGILIAYLGIVLLCFAINISESSENQEQGLPKEAVSYIKKEYKDEELRLFTDYNWGGYAEFMGLKPFIDARAEVFLKVNNGKEDILNDLLAVDAGSLYYADFIKKYKLNVFLIEKNELLDIYLGKDDGYEKVFQDKKFVVYEKIN
jgi:hypothetical protein